MDAPRIYGPYCNTGGYWFTIEVAVDGSHRSVWTHRQVVEHALGRPLTDAEVVHHKNGDPGDNRITNLEVIVSQGVHAQLHARACPMLKLRCLCCNETFQQAARHVRRSNTLQKNGPFCSRRCAARWQYARRETPLRVRCEEHGSTLYRNGCRCVVCRAAHAARQMKYRTRVALAKTPGK